VRQHLVALDWLAQITGADVTGNKLGSTDLTFVPALHQTVQPADDGEGCIVIITVDTVGSTSLVLQTVLPYIVCCSSTWPKPIRLVIRGGTHVQHAPSADYVKHVLLPTLGYCGILPNYDEETTMAIDELGWSQGPSQAGQISLRLEPDPVFSTAGLPSPDRRGPKGELTRVLVCSRVPLNVLRHLQTQTERLLQESFPDAEIVHTAESCDSLHKNRFYLLLVGVTSNGYRFGRDWLYDKKILDPQKAATHLSNKVVSQFRLDMSRSACVDEFLHDQLVVFQALAEANSTVARNHETVHTKTAKWVTSKLLGVSWEEEDECDVSQRKPIKLAVSGGLHGVNRAVSSQNLVEELSSLKINDSTGPSQ
jgi:RNA 3'-terminal phosphate cyclase (ATP)